MKSISNVLMVIVILLSSINSFAQIKNEKTETVKIYGNCGMCKSTIEKAGNLKNVAKVDWNEDTQLATIKYDSEKTNQDEILKRIALVGYDNEKFLAPDEVYNKLHGCCQYDRELVNTTDATVENSSMHNAHEGHHQHGAEAVNTTPLQAVYNAYYALKDVLISSDAKASASKSEELLAALKAVDMAKLSSQEHTVWMKIQATLTADATKIAAAKNIAKQREVFSVLSQNMYDLVKVSKLDKPVYYLHCPMFNNGKGANWLSKEDQVKNPYYGAQMLTCGSVKETIGK